MSEWWPSGLTSPHKDSFGIGVLNNDDAAHTLSVTVRDGDELLLETVCEAEAGPGQGSGVARDIVTEEGVYTVTVEDETGQRVEHDWRVEDALGQFGIVIASDGQIEFAYTVRCTPDCPPCSQPGTAVDRPYESDDHRDTVRSEGIKIRNRTSDPETLTVRITDGHREVFNYTYRVEPEWRPSIAPRFLAPGEYDVTVETEGGQMASYRWAVWGLALLFIEITSDGVLVGCGRSGDQPVPITNEDDREHTLHFTAVDQDIEATTTRTIAPRFEGSIPCSELAPTGREYTLTVKLEDGRTETTDWVNCNGRFDNLSVRITDTGALQLDIETRRVM